MRRRKTQNELKRIRPLGRRLHPSEEGVQSAAILTGLREGERWREGPGCRHRWTDANYAAERKPAMPVRQERVPSKSAKERETNLKTL
ncbi:hypothetical protein NHX12_023543 [Muraenolepis orangiensis]|uniref:Uncharacterized protein n=1 Tax=Muraenolepis orangiensis TaxID=630683 RepID=A0A9Q0ENA8_9TELE|nr:hypothetical protein NHX12_023543 [Muraenolepis orangiensis]